MIGTLHLAYFYILYFVYYFMIFVCGLRSDMPFLINE